MQRRQRCSFTPPMSSFVCCIDGNAQKNEGRGACQDATLVGLISNQRCAGAALVIFFW